MTEQAEGLRGRRIGHLRLVNLIAEGGMGTVYSAVDDRLDRTVAVKAIRKARRLEPGARARFLREAKILSQLEHPNVCQLHDYIEGDDSDFLVLELVSGRNLRVALEEELDRPSLLKIAEQLLDVLAAVHGQGVIHRDLKPENVMVTPAGDIKVLDFGLARPTGAADSTQPLEESHGHEAPSEQGLPAGAPGHGLSETRHGTIVGTAGYMSPEQARGERATPASDIYSLGLLFQEMFTGRPPYPADLDAKELQRRAMWGETGAVDGLPPDLTALINRMKSLAPGSRPSAVDGADLLKRIVRRPRQQRRLAIIAAVWILLVLFAGGMTIQYVRAERESRKAVEEAITSQLVVDTLVGLFRVADPTTQPGEEVTAAEIVHRGAAQIEEQLADRPLLQARLRQVIGEVYEGLGLYLESIQQLEAALETRIEIQGSESLDVARTLNWLALVYRNAEDTAACEDLARRALQILSSGEAPLDNETLGHTKTLLGSCVLAQGQTEEALQLDREAVALLSSALGDEHPRTLLAGVELAASLRASGELDEAETLLRDLLEKQKRAVGPGSIEVARSLNNLAYLLRSRDDFVEAEQRYREALEIQVKLLPETHPLNLRVLQNLSAVLFYQGKLDETEETLRKIVELRRAAHPEGHTTLATALVSGLGRFLMDEHRYAEARPAIEDGMSVYEGILGPDHPRTAVTRGCLGAADIGAGRTDEGQRLITESLAVLEAQPDIDYSHKSSIRHLARHLEEAGYPGLRDRYLALIRDEGPTTK